MKQDTNKVLIVMTLILLFTALIYSFTGCNYPKTNKIKIIEKYTDERGLTSVIFTQGKDTLGLDYLTKNELDSLTK